MIQRGGVHWADFGAPAGSRPAKFRPVVVVQSDLHNASRLATIVVAALTSQTDLARHPGNVFVPANASGLSKDSVINVTTLSPFNRYELSDPVGLLPVALMQQLDAGLRLVLGL